MPIYSYYCPACNKQFEVFKHRDDAATSEKCKDCSCEANRDWAADQVYMKPPVKTLGVLADKNAEKLSQDEQNSILEKTRRKQ